MDAYGAYRQLCTSMSVAFREHLLYIHYIMIIETMEVHPAALVGLLCARAGAVRIPAQPWALEIAVEVIDREAPASSVLSRSLSYVRRRGDPSRDRRLNVASLLRGLVRSGHLRPEGSGWHAGYAVSSNWLNRQVKLFGVLPARDRAALARAGQRFRAVLAARSKKVNDLGTRRRIDLPS